MAGNTITISGRLTFSDGRSIAGARVKIWETDTLQKNNPDDLIVNAITTSGGNFTGTGVWRDSGNLAEIGTYRYEVTFEGKVKTGGNITNPLTFFSTLKMPWKSPQQEAAELAARSITITGRVVFDDGSPISGARVRIWETDDAQPNNPDDLIVNMISNASGNFSGTGVWKDGGNTAEIGTYRYEVVFEGKTKTGNNIMNPLAFFSTLRMPWKSPAQEAAILAAGTITISGRVTFNDGSTLAGARVRIWETDEAQPNNPDDLIVDMNSDGSGNFSGSGFWKDGNNPAEIGTYRWQVDFGGVTTSGNNITNPAVFFAVLNSRIPSPAEENITITGRLLYKDHHPISGASVRIWETDSLQPGNEDDLIVNMTTGTDGNFSGTGKWLDSGNNHEIGTYRYEVNFNGVTKTGENISNPHAFFRELVMPWNRLETWTNWIHDYETNVEIRKPTSRDELQGILEEALAQSKKIKPVGSGHSHSMVAAPQPDHILVDFHGLSGELRDYPWLKDEYRLQSRHLQRVKAGTQIRHANVQVLAPQGLALLNQGPYDGQTLAGAINTNTHGTGIAVGGFADMVMSVEMLVVVPDPGGAHRVEIWVVEPENGISDPVRIRTMARNMHLVQNDDIFHSVVCGYGLFGIAYSYTLEVREMYWLKERYECTNWGEIKRRFRPESITELLNDFAQVKVYVHTSEWLKYAAEKGKDSITCRIDTWEETRLPLPEKPAGWDDDHEIHKIWPPMRPRGGDSTKDALGHSFKIRGANGDGRAADMVINTVKTRFFEASDRGKSENGLFLREEDVLKAVSPGQEECYKSASACYRVIRRVRDNDIHFDESLRSNTKDNTVVTGDCVPEDYGPSVEICVPLDQTIQACEAILDFLATKDVNFSPPTGIRFVKASEHYLCPAAGRDCTFIEIVGWLPDQEGTEGTKDWERFRSIYEQTFDELFAHLRTRLRDVRFHLGKNNNYSSDSLRADFSRYPDWVRNYHLFNATGVFDCPNSDRWNLDVDRPGLSLAQVAMELENLKS